MKNSIRNLIVTVAMVCGIFGIVMAEETTNEATTDVSVKGELSTDITFGDATTFASPYTGLTLSGDGWELSTNLSDGNVNIEEAKYTWSVTDYVKLTFGS